MILLTTYTYIYPQAVFGEPPGSRWYSAVSNGESAFRHSSGSSKRPVNTGTTPLIPTLFEPGRETLTNVSLVRRISPVVIQFQSLVAGLPYDDQWKGRVLSMGMAITSGSLRLLSLEVQQYKDFPDGLKFVVDVLNAIFPCDEIFFEIGFVQAQNKKGTVPVFSIICPRLERMLAFGTEEQYGVVAFSVIEQPVERREFSDDDIRSLYKQFLSGIEPADPGPPPIG